MKQLLFISDMDWANVTTLLSIGINKYSSQYQSNVICIREHPFKYNPLHQMNLKDNSCKQYNIKNLITDADLIIYCEEVQHAQLCKLIPQFNDMLKNKKQIVYHASYMFNNALNDSKYLLQLFVPEIYYLGLPNKRHMVIPACPVIIPDNIDDIINNKCKNGKILISHASSRDDNGKLKGSNIIVKQIKLLQNKHNHIEFINYPYKKLSNAEILRTKLDTDIYIDQYNPEVGGFGVSSIESIIYGCIVLSSTNKIDPIFNQLFNSDGNFPIININNEAQIFEELDKLCSLSRDELMQMMHRNIEWMRKNLTDKYIQYYETFILNPILD